MIVRDQIHGDIEFSNAEMRLIRSRSFERLRYIKQLGFAEFVFPGATHNRYQHSLGVCQCVTDMYNEVVKNNPDFYREGDLELLRLIALVHDIGHSPFSHASEELSNISHEERMEDIIELEKKNIILAHNYDISSTDLINQVYNGDGFTYMSDPHLVTLHSFMDNFIDADKLDYLERDSINCGVNYGLFDREGLINNLTVMRDPNGKEVIGIYDTGMQAFESFMLARYYMFSQVYMHPQERIYRYQYCDEMKNLLPDCKYPDDVKKFLALDDTKYSRRLKFLKNHKYELIYDSEYDLNIVNKINRKFGNLILCDTPMKYIFRRDNSDSTIYVKSKLTGVVKPCSEVSPIIRGIEFTKVHKLRIYAESDIAEEMKHEVLNYLQKIS